MPYRPRCTLAWPVQPMIFVEDRNGAGTQELRLGSGTGRYDDQFLISSAISVHAKPENLTHKIIGTIYVMACNLKGPKSAIYANIHIYHSISLNQNYY